MNKDFLIVSGEWHDGLPCLMREGNPGGVLGLVLLLESHLFSLDTFCTHLSMFMLAIGFFSFDLCHFLLTKFFVF